MKIIWSSCCFIIFTGGYAQPETQSLPLDTIRQKESLTQWAYQFATTPDAPIETVLTAWRAGAFQHMRSSNLGYNDQALWFAIPISLKNASREFFLEVANPHLDKISAFLIDSTQHVSPIGNPTGDNLPFDSRSYINRHFVWPLNSADISGKSLLIRVEKLNSSLQVPLWMWEQNAFRQANTRTTLLYGIGFGMMLLVVIYSLLAWILIRNWLYAAYFFLICCSIFLLAINEGFAFQFIYPAWGGLNSILRVTMGAVTNGAFVLFSFLFLNVRTRLPGLNQLFFSLLAFYAVALIATPLTAGFLVRHSSMFLPFILTVILFGNLLCVYAAMRTYKKQQVLSGLYLTAYSAVLVATLTTELDDYGVWTQPFNFLFVGVLIEMLVFSIALTYLMRNVYIERNQLWLSISRHQKEIMQSYIKGIELERQRVSRDLHDDIGSRLGNLRRMVETGSQPDERIIEQIEILSKDVRTISHRLSPPERIAKNLVGMVEALAQEIQQTSGIHFSVQAFDFPEELDPILVSDLYHIIQEAIQNIVRHAQASTADIQFFRHENELVLTVDDNGRGFSTGGKSDGIGLRNMQVRAANAGGMFEMTSEPGKGTHILISIPQNANRGFSDTPPVADDVVAGEN